MTTNRRPARRADAGGTVVHAKAEVPTRTWRRVLRVLVGGSGSRGVNTLTDVRRAVLGVLALSLVAATVLIIPAANAHTRTCGQVTGRNGGTTSPVHARHVGCRTARRVTRYVIDRPCPIGGKPCHVRANGIRFTCRSHDRGAIVTHCRAGRRKHVDFAED